MEEIYQRIPHRPPFLFLDSILEKSVDRLTAEKTWTVDEGFYAGHYPGNPITPGVLLCESVFQAGAVFLSQRMEALDGEADALSGTTPVLSRIEGAKFKAMVKPGETCRIEVQYKEQLSRFHFLRGKVLNAAGKTALTLEFALALVEGPNE